MDSPFDKIRILLRLDSKWREVVNIDCNIFLDCLLEKAIISNEEAESILSAGGQETKADTLRNILLGKLTQNNVMRFQEAVDFSNYEYLVQRYIQDPDVAIEAELVQLQSQLKNHYIQCYKDDMFSWNDSQKVALNTLFVPVQLKDCSSQETTEDLWSKFNPVNGEHFLIIGPASCGKTTLLKHLAYQWATQSGHGNASDRPMDKVKMLLLLKLRLVDGQKSLKENVQKQLDCFQDFDKFWALVEWLCGESYPRVMFLFDGLDEYISHDNEIKKLLNGEHPLLRRTFLILTSRPEGREKSKSLNTVFCVEEITGFNENKIKVCIIKCFQVIGRPECSLPLISCLFPGENRSDTQWNKELRDLSQIPGDLILMCLLYAEDSERFHQIKSREQLFEEYVKCLVANWEKRQGMRISSKKNILSNHREILIKFGRLAVSSIQNGISLALTFELQQLLQFEIDPTGNEFSIGLICQSDFSGKNRLEESRYYFAHKCLQEYCVGYYFKEEFDKISALLPKPRTRDTLCHILDISLLQFVLYHLNSSQVCTYLKDLVESDFVCDAESLCFTVMKLIQYYTLQNRETYQDGCDRKWEAYIKTKNVFVYCTFPKCLIFGKSRNLFPRILPGRSPPGLFEACSDIHFELPEEVERVSIYRDGERNALLDKQLLILCTDNMNVSISKPTSSSDKLKNVLICDLNGVNFLPPVEILRIHRVKNLEGSVLKNIAEMTGVLRKLLLNDCNLGCESMKILDKHYDGPNKLECLGLSNNKSLRGEGSQIAQLLKKICQSRVDTTTRLNLDLSGCGLTDIDVESIISESAITDTILGELDLRNNNFSRNITAKLIRLNSNPSQAKKILL